MKRLAVHALVALCVLALHAPAQDKVSDRLAEERARRDLVAQKNYLLVERHLANARAFEERLDLPAAEAELLKARAIDPTNRIVGDYLAQVQLLLGKPEAEARVLAVSAAQRYEAHRQQMKAAAQQDLATAQKLLEAGDPGQAAILAHNVVNQVQWSTGVEWGDIAARANALLAQAQRASEGATDVTRAERERAAYEALQAEEARQAEQSQAQVDAMIEASTTRFLRNDFTGAAELAEAALEQQPDNARALQLIEAAREARRENANREFIQQRREEFSRWREAMEAVRIPYDDIITEPGKEDWAELTRRRTSGGVLGKAADPEELALRAKLQSTRMNADFQELTIEQVANNILFSTDIPVSVDPEVRAELDSAAEYVTLTGLRDIPVESLLNILVDQVGEDLAWTIRNGRVYITKSEKAAGQPIPHIHNIQDLTFPITDFKGVNIREIPLPGAAGDSNENTIFNSELDRVRLIEPDEVLNLVRENIARESWDGSLGYSIDFVDSNNLLVIHTPDVQQEVADFLDDLRAFSTTMVTLEARFFAITDAFIEEIGTDLRGLGPGGNLGDQTVLDAVDPSNSQGLDNNGNGTGNPNAGIFFDQGTTTYAAATENFFNNPLGDLLSTIGGGAFQFAVLDDEQFNIVINAVQKSRNAFEISSPIVSVYNTQRAFVTVVNQVSFVQGFDVDVANGAFIADPNIGVVQEGIVLDVRPTISFDRKYVTLDVQATVADLVRPIRQVTTNLGGDSSAVQFSLPQLDVRDAQTTVVVPDKGSVVLGGLKHVNYQNRTAETPWLAQIPILGFLFREKGLADETTDMIIVIRATITDFSEIATRPVSGTR
jgi:hypothetical protein